MNRDSGEVSEYQYREYAGGLREADYAHPDYYKGEAANPSQPARTHDPYAHIPEYSSYEEAHLYDPDPTQLQAYADGQVMATYPPIEGGAEHKENTEQGSKVNVRRRAVGLGGILIAIGGWLLKLKSLTLFLKFGMTGLSVLLSIVLYSFAFGWWFAIGFVALIFVHEMGHVLVMKLKGLPISGMIFIPFVAAAVIGKQMPKNAKDEAEVGIAGPVAGALAALLCLLIAKLLPDPGLWAPLAYMGFFLNLINLVPIVPLDGGRIMGAVDRRFWIVGFIALLAFQIWQWMNGNTSWWLLLIIFVAASQLWSRGLKPDTAETREYYTVPLVSRIVLTVLYFGLAAALFMGMGIAHALIVLH